MIRSARKQYLLSWFLILFATYSIYYIILFYVTLCCVVLYCVVFLPFNLNKLNWSLDAVDGNMAKPETNGTTEVMVLEDATSAPDADTSDKKDKKKDGDKKEPVLMVPFFAVVSIYVVAIRGWYRLSPLLW